MSSLALDRPRQDVSARPNPWRRLVDVWRYRELLGNLVRKELKVKYKNSVLGFVWSLLNPALYLVVFYVVFELVLSSGIPRFPIYLLSGLLAWNLFANSLGAGTQSIVANGSLVSKVWFPREILPLASVAAGLVFFALQITVLAFAMAVSGHSPAWSYCLLLLPALAVLVLLLGALSIALSAMNVYLRDTGHLLELAMLAWFWLTPIVYPFRLVADKLNGPALPLLNPVTSVTLTFQRALYNRVESVDADGVVTAILPDESVLWYGRNLLVVGAVSFLLLLGALWIFGRLEDNLAEEL